MQKKLAILGSTGSIGTQTLDIVANNPDKFMVHSLATHKNVSLLKQQVQKFKPAMVGISDTNVDFTNLVGQTKVVQGMESLVELATHPQVDMVVVATSGTVGIMATLAAIQANKEIALANKETLVIGGELVMASAKANNIEIRPIDSEHSALWQCLVGEDYDNIRRLLLTASGGPFRTWDITELENVTPKQALKHPNWSMGKKVTIDSATLMNKGLEVIEAHWLFGQPYNKIEALIHPQSIVHSMVEFIDGSIKAQLNMPDMHHAIQYALTYPSRISSKFTELDWTKTNMLTFEKPDLERFPCLDLAYHAGKLGGTYPAALVASDEVLVDLFLSEQVAFMDIAPIIRDVLASHDNTKLTLESVHETMAWAKAKTYELAE
ncbi:MAG: 1-deoxy-D-xylulose-5-phosphate reductoisomerase [Anaerolineaceae bacterium 4572_78]|nr:MAG: 1-deoxy-D-xylulose-5-phosphate reductoisomerase [Anaerolineaceae bacterium 4572_78]